MPVVAVGVRRLDGRLKEVTAPLVSNPFAPASQTVNQTVSQVDTLSTQYRSQLQSWIASAPSTVQSQLQSATGINTSNATVSKGATAVMGLIQNGYDPSNDADNASLVQAIAGGLALIPGVGIILGAYVEGLWLVGNQVACPLEKAFASIGLGSPSPACGGQVCATTGNFTAQSVLVENQGWLPPLTQGTFASIAIPALATYAAQSANCKGGPDPGTIIDGVAAIWNKTNSGPPTQIYVPSMLVWTSGAPATVLLAGAGESISGSSAAAMAGQDPNIFYAFGPLASILAAGAASIVNGSVVLTATPGGLSASVTRTAPRTISINGASPASSGGIGTLVGHAAALAAGGAVGGLLYAWATGKAVDVVFDKGWTTFSDWVKRASGEVLGKF
jgi:hypothetical protein